MASPSAASKPVAPPTVDPQKIVQAHQLLDRWNSLHVGASADTFEFTNGLAHGGGWSGANGNDQKVAFMVGLIEAVDPLPADVPPPGTIEWAEGTKQTVELVSAADALAGLIANADDPTGTCQDCMPLQVTGAHLTAIDTSTTHGDATVPAWQFDFDPNQTPLDPITFVAVKGASAGSGENLPGATNDGNRIDAAYGNPQSTQITVSFIGSPSGASNPCGADYTGTAVESDKAVAVIISEQRSSVPFPRPSGAVYACPAVGYTRTVAVDLAQPLGNRAILDVNYAVAVTLKDEPPPTFPVMP